MYILNGLSTTLWQGQHIPGADVWALVNGDTETALPHAFLRSALPRGVRVVMSAPLLKSHDRSWIQRKNGRQLVMRTWSTKELLVAGCVPATCGASE
jgi:hypothetical protein